MALEVLEVNRLGIAFFYDEHSVVDDYIFYLLESLSPFNSRTIFVSNCKLDRQTVEKLEASGCEVLLRENKGFDVGAYKAAIEYVGYENLAIYDEILLYNHTFYGPIFPFEEMFSAMNERSCDFWGITAHKEMIPNPFTKTGVLPRHLNSHFIVVRRKMAISQEFREYWEEMPLIRTYTDSVLKHESKFTKHFQDFGYVCGVYDDDSEYGSEYPCFMSVDEAIDRRCPILKRRIFFHDPMFHEQNAIDLPLALQRVSENSDYDQNLIWKNILRGAKLRNLNTNAALTSVLPHARIQQSLPRHSIVRIAVCAHIYYDDMVEELLNWTRNISVPYDFIATTDTEEKAERIRVALKREKCIADVVVRVLDVNRGRDMSSLFIACRDLFLEDRYDLVCRLHTKKSPQVAAARSNIFKRHMFENLLASPGYVENVLDLFETKPWVGLAVPPIVHISYPTMGNGWFANKPGAIELAKRLDIHVEMDEHTPVAAYGTMFWFRPRALQKLFNHQWAWDEFNAEPNHVDGGLAHILERLISYTAQDAGYATQQIFSPRQAEFNYAMLEFKHQRLAAHLPWNFAWQDEMLRKWKQSGFPLTTEKEVEKEYRGAFWNHMWVADEPVSEKVNTDPWRVAAYRDQKTEWRNKATETRSMWKRLFGRKYTSFSEADVTLVEKFLLRSGITCIRDFNFNDLRARIRYYLSFGWLMDEEIFFLFDSDYYMTRYGENVDRQPLVHYLRTGAQKGFDPHPLFDTKYFLSRVAGTTEIKNPLKFFLAQPLDLAISPHPLFDMGYYRGCYPEVMPAGFNPLIHYLAHGARNKYSPHPLFDSHFYLESNPDLEKSGINPLLHYLAVGEASFHDPHPLFDVDYYLKANIGQIESKSPLIDFVLHGGNGSREPHPLFEAGLYRERYRDQLSKDENPLVHFLSGAWQRGLQPSGHFELDWYLEHNKDVCESMMNPLVHYVLYGAEQGRELNSVFDAVYYLWEYPEVASTGLTPYQHFIKYGAGERRNPSRDFDTSYYVEKYDISVARAHPVSHFISTGRARGYTTAPK